MVFKKAVVVAAGLSLSLIIPVSQAEAGGTLSEASELSAVGSASVIAGSVMAIVGTGELIVESIQWLAEGGKCVLKGSAEVGRVVILLPVKVAGGVSLAVGQTVQVTAGASGWLLTKAGEVIAFIPNEVGRALLFSEPVSGR